MHLAYVSAIVPFHAVVQPLRPRGSAAPRPAERLVARHKKNLPVPPLGRFGLRPGAMTDLHRFADIHTHDTRLASAGTAVVSISPDDPMEPHGTYSVGIHPWDTVRPVTLRQLKALVRRARNPRTAAIGECGFDALRGGDPDIQRRLFDLHARLAERTGKPLIIHAVRSNRELLDAIRRHRPSVEWIIHGFRGKPELARQLVRAGYSISLGPRHNPGVPTAIPPERLYRETDSAAPSA